MNEEYLRLIESTLEEVLPSSERPEVLCEAMRYAVGTGGKRIRPQVCLAAAEAVGGRAEDAKYPAAAIELLHNYTLIHDDLPSMDGDKERRGKPTVWVKYGEALAILAGDALNTLAFKVLACTPRNLRQVLDTLGTMGVGVVAGQVEDINPAHQDATFIYEHKTADLFIASAVMGGWAAGGTQDEIEALREYALNLGLAFQYQDDLIDGDGLYPPEATRNRAQAATASALAALGRLSGDTSALERIARALVGRKI